MGVQQVGVVGVVVVVVEVVETMTLMLSQGAAVHGHLWQPRNWPGGGAAAAAAAAAAADLVCFAIDVALQVDVEIDDGRSVLNRHVP